METRAGLRRRFGGIRWLYALALVPSITELLENGRLPSSFRALITDGVMTVVLLILARIVCRRFGNIQMLRRTDSPTGLYNAVPFDVDLDTEVRRAHRSRQDLALALIDVDEFKSVNDRLGHAAGNRILRRVALTLRGAIRVNLDGCYRISGDEFAVILLQADEPAAISVLSHVLERANEESRSLQLSGSGLSIGIATMRPGEEPSELFRRADSLLYRAKGEGKNRIAV